jgi:glycolate oxidase
MLCENTLNELRTILGSANVLSSRVSLESYSYDASPFTGKPEAVVFVDSTEQIRQLMLLASKRNIAITPRGAGTNVSGGCIAEHGGIILAMNRMDQILEIDPINETALVEPGVTNMTLQNAAVSDWHDSSLKVSIAGKRTRNSSML